MYTRFDMSCHDRCMLGFGIIDVILIIRCMIVYVWILITMLNELLIRLRHKTQWLGPSPSYPHT